ncbi:2968_t:CDS:2, partial [Dentiscutata heterogama]
LVLRVRAIGCFLNIASTILDGHSGLGFFGYNSTLIIMAETLPEMQKLVKEASDIKYIPGAALKTYFRSANALLRQAHRYKEENDLINAFKFYVRYATLTLEKLPHHPEYKKPEHKAGKVELAKNSKIVLDEIEKLKPMIQERFRRSAEKELVTNDISL